MFSGKIPIPKPALGIGIIHSFRGDPAAEPGEWTAEGREEPGRQ